MADLGSLPPSPPFISLDKEQPQSPNQQASPATHSVMSGLIRQCLPGTRQSKPVGSSSNVRVAYSALPRTPAGSVL